MHLLTIPNYSYMSEVIIFAGFVVEAIHVSLFAYRTVNQMARHLSETFQLNLSEFRY